MKFFIDENMPALLAEGLSVLEKPNNDGVEVFSILKEFGRGTQDEDWIPKVGDLGGIIITQDSKMQRIKNQYELLKKYKVGIFYLIPPNKSGYTYWEMVTKIVNHWKDMKELSRKSKPPFAYKITPRKIEKIS